MFELVVKMMAANSSHNDIDMVGIVTTLLSHDKYS